jgi:indolepyruvate ferredoxin oxidoreductase
VREILARLTPENHAIGVELARLPERIRGFGAVKRKAADGARAEAERLLVKLRAEPAPLSRAA